MERRLSSRFKRTAGEDQGIVEFTVPEALVTASAAAQASREVRRAATVQPLPNEPQAKIIIDSPLAEALSRGVAFLQYRRENLHILPVFGPAALAVSRAGAAQDPDPTGECRPSTNRPRHGPVHDACREAAAVGTVEPRRRAVGTPSPAVRRHGSETPRKARHDCGLPSRSPIAPKVSQSRVGGGHVFKLARGTSA